MATSQNGYTANDEGLLQTWTIPGTTRRVRLRVGAPGGLLVHLAAWFHQHVEPIDTGELDDWGYASRPIRGSATELSNHASGTALDLNATKHPLGERGTFTSAQAAAIRAQLLQYDGCIRWGGDYTKRADEMHFEIVRSPADCAFTLARLTKTQPTTEDEMTPAQMQELKDFIEKRTQAYAVANNDYVRQILGNTSRALVAAIRASDQDQANRILAELAQQAEDGAKASIASVPAADLGPTS